MVITYFKKTGEYHFEHNGIDDCDGDDGFFFEYSIADMDVHMAIAEFIYEDYILPVMPSKTEYQIDTQNFIKRIWDFISDCDLLEVLKKVYYDQLHDYFEEEALKSAETI